MGYRLVRHNPKLYIAEIFVEVKFHHIEILINFVFWWCYYPYIWITIWRWRRMLELLELFPAELPAIRITCKWRKHRVARLLVGQVLWGTAASWIQCCKVSSYLWVLTKCTFLASCRNVKLHFTNMADVEFIAEFILRPHYSFNSCSGFSFSCD
jgi:hypothetical protein